MRDNARKIGKRGRPWCIIEWVSRGLIAWPCVLSDRPPVLWWLSPGEGWAAVTWCGWEKLEKGRRCLVYELRGVCWWLCVLSDLTWLPLLGGGRKSWYIITNQIIVLVLWHYKNNNIIRISVLLTYSDVEAVLCKLPCPAAWNGDSESLSRLLSVRSLGQSAHNISNTVRSLAQIITYRVAHFTKVKYWQYKLLLNGLLEHI